MLSGSSPFDEEEGGSADYVLDQIILEQFSAEARDLINKLLVVEPEERLSSEQILSHPWLQVKLEWATVGGNKVFDLSFVILLGV